MRGLGRAHLPLAGCAGPGVGGPGVGEAKAVGRPLASGWSLTLRPPGFEGTLCERNVDDCSPDPCHHGRCVDGIASFSCACAPGYTGTRCESQVDECRSQPCRHGGKCLDLVDKYLCRCPPGTTGGAGGWAGPETWKGTEGLGMVPLGGLSGGSPCCDPLPQE